MMREKKYVLGSRVRSPSPQRQTLRYRDSLPSRHHEYLSRSHEMDDYLRTRGPPRSKRTDRRDYFDRDLHLQAAKFSDYRDRDRESDRYKDVGHSRRLHGEETLVGDSTLRNFQHDYPLDNSQNFDGPGVKDYVNDYHGVSDTTITRLAGERNYCAGSKYLDECISGLPARSLYRSKPSPLETERTLSRHSDSYTSSRVDIDSPPKRLAGYDISSHHAPSSLQYPSTDCRKDGGFHFVDEFHLQKKARDIPSRDRYYLDKKDDHFRSGNELNLDEFIRPIDRETYKYNREDNLLPSRGYLRGDIDHTNLSSRHKNFAPGSPAFSSKEDPYVPSNGTRLRTGMTSEPFSCDVSGEKLNKSPKQPSQDISSYSRSCFGALEERHADYFYSEFGTSEIGNSRSTELTYGRKLADVKEYRTQDTSRNDFMEPIDVTDESQTRVRDVGVRKRNASSLGQLTYNDFSTIGSLYPRKHETEISGYGSTCLSYDREVYNKYGSIEPRKLHSDDTDDGPWTCQERPDKLRMKAYGLCLDQIGNSPQKRLAARDFSPSGQSERKLRRKHFRGKKLHEHGVGRNCSSYGKSHQVHLKNLDMKSGARDIKKRLGPRPHKLHVTQRIAEKYRPSLQKRLGPVKIHHRLPWVENFNSKNFPKDQNDLDVSPDEVVSDHLEDNVLLEKLEPSERSDEFKQLVRSAFLKFLKQMSETPTKRKTYTGQVKNYSLRCLVCGSSSDQFVDTEKLAMHAFTSTKFGLRSRHLGLHKALCMLMGWRSAEDFSGQWLCEVISDAETSSIKEDLIIWPPVVIIHNSTIRKKNPEEQVVISIEAVESKLREMGFGNIGKVCSGKPANQSVMLVKFSGTLSGLQEAERLHKKYLEAKHGRIDFQQFLCHEDGSSTEATQIAPAEKEEKLYGYLGLVEDLDKLDFDTKKRCVVRSKKEIQSIANASLMEGAC